MHLLATLSDTLAAMATIAKTDPVVGTTLGLIQTGQLQVVDHRFVGVREISNQTLIKLLDSADTKQIGINNLSNGKPAPNQLMLVTGVKLMALQNGAAITPAILRAANYGELTDVAGLINGVITIKSDGKNIVFQHPLSAFMIGNRRDEKGVYHLKFPKVIYPDRDLQIEIDLGTAPAPANSAVKWELIGECTSV